MTVSSTATRYLLSNALPRTQLVVGQWYGSTHWAGVAVDTVENVRFFANGTDLTKSDLVAQAVGQVWLQSLGKTVAFAKKDLLVASHQATMIAAEVPSISEGSAIRS